MRIKQIIENTSTTAGSISTVAMPLTTQTRESVDVPGLKPVGKVMTGKAKKKGPYANSIIEGKVSEATLEEDDIILNPRLGRLRKSGFMSNDRDSEGQTFKNSLHTIVRVASQLDKELSNQDEFPEWMSEKIGAVKSMMVSIMNYVISAQEMQRDPDAMNENGSLAYEASCDAGSEMNSMAEGELRNIVKNSKLVYELLKHGKKLDTWEYSYITVANDRLQTVHEVLSTEENPIDENARKMSEGMDPFVAGKLNKLKDLNPVDRASAYGSIRSWLKDNPELAGQASKLASAYAMADVARQQYKTAQAKQMLADLEPQHQAFIKQALGQEQGVAEGVYSHDVKRAFPNGKASGVKSHPAVVKTSKPIGTRVSDIGPGGKEYNVKTDKAWDNENKKK